VLVGIPELKLSSEQDMTVLFPPDMMTYGLGEEIIIEITGLFKKPERTRFVRHCLAVQLGSTVKKLFTNAKVECLVHPFNPVDGFWTSDT
jgi:hypothetical protein